MRIPHVRAVRILLVAGMILAPLPLLAFSYRGDSFVYVRPQGVLDLSPYLDKSRLYLVVSDGTFLDKVLGDYRFRKDRILSPEGKEALIGLPRPLPDAKSYSKVLNALSKDRRVDFAAPVFRFTELSGLPFRSMLSVGSSVTFQFKPGISAEVFKESFQRIGIEKLFINESPGGVRITLPRNSAYDPLRLAAFFSPYYDPRIVEGSLEWIRLEPPAEASVRMYPAGSTLSSAGFLTLENVTVEVSVKTLPDVEFRPQEINPATTLMRSWQPESKDQKSVFDFFDEEPTVIKEEREGFFLWKVRLGGRFIQFGDFKFPNLAVPIHLLKDKNASVLSSVETNQLMVRVPQLSPPDTADVVLVKVGSVPYASAWRIDIFYGGIFVFILGLGFILLPLRNRVKTIFCKQKIEPSLKKLFEDALKPLNDMYNGFISRQDGFSEVERKAEWFSLVHSTLGLIDKILHNRPVDGYQIIINMGRKEIERKEFSGLWNQKLCEDTFLTVVRLAESLIPEERGGS